MKKIGTLKTPTINQNGYHKNILTKERIGTLFIYPTDYTPDDCLSCDGYSLLIIDYEDLYKVIGKQFNQENDLENTFRIPDYNITGRFLQPNSNVGVQIDAGLPNITATFGVLSGPQGSPSLAVLFIMQELLALVYLIIMQHTTDLFHTLLMLPVHQQFMANLLQFNLTLKQSVSASNTNRKIYENIKPNYK